jgi:transcriptional regulator with XRE-family HTH domain
MTGNQLRELREARNLTREALAQWLGDCSASTVNKWERDMHSIPAWVEEKMLSNVQISLPLHELKLLMDYAESQRLSFEQLLGRAILDYIRKPKAEVYPFPDQTETQDNKVAEDVVPYGTKPWPDDQTKNA